MPESVGEECMRHITTELVDDILIVNPN